MPYSGASDKDLPSYVKKLPLNKRKQWVSVFNSTLAEKKDEAIAFKYANGVVKRKKDYYDEELVALPDKKLFAFETNYRPYGAKDGEGCATCWWRQKAGLCYLLYNEIMDTGTCDIFRLPPGVEEVDDEGVMTQIKSILEALDE